MITGIVLIHANQVTALITHVTKKMVYNVTAVMQVGGASIVQKHAEITVIPLSPVTKAQGMQHVSMDVPWDGGAQTVYRDAVLTVHRTSVDN